MLDPLSGDVAREEFDERRAGTLREAWRLLKWFLALSALVLGPAVIVSGVGLAAATFWTRPRGPHVRPVPGAVVALERRLLAGTHTGSNVVYAPVVRFSLAGHARQFTGRLATERPLWEIGQTVTILYDPDTDRAELVGWETWSRGVEFLAVGTTILAIGILLRRRGWTRLALRARDPRDGGPAGRRLPATAQPGSPPQEPRFAAPAWRPVRSVAPGPAEPPPEAPRQGVREGLGLPPELDDKTLAGRLFRFVVGAALCGAPAGYLMVVPGILAEVSHFGRSVRSPLADQIGSWAWPVGLAVGCVAGCCAAFLGDRFVAPVVRCIAAPADGKSATPSPALSSSSSRFRLSGIEGRERTSHGGGLE